MYPPANQNIGELFHNSTGNLLDRNISSYNETKTKGNKFIEDVVHVNHLYLKEELSVPSLEEYRNKANELERLKNIL